MKHGNVRLTAQQLQNSILQLAVQGKLVPQDPHDEPASVLLEKIWKEKQSLVKTGKVKKEKPSKPIANEEILFDIPASWEWVRLGMILSVSSGVALTSANMNKNGNIPVYGGNGIAGMHSDFNISKPALVIGRVGFYCGCTHITEGKAWVTDNALIVTFPEENINIKWLKIVVETLTLRKRSSSTAQPVISGKTIYPLLFPLPPLEEQKCIVAKTEELMLLVDTYDKAEQKLNALNTAFPDLLKKAVLQDAVRGNLAPQDPRDEPASVLLEKNRKEKQSFTKGGKPPKPITDEEIPFDIPANWRWVRLGEICVYIQRGKSPKYSPIKKYPVIAQKCNQWQGLKIDKAQFIDPDSLLTYAKERILQDEDLLWNSTGLGTLGRIVLYRSRFNPYELAVADSHVTVIRTLKRNIMPLYLYYYIANPTVQKVIEDMSEGSTKQKELATTTILNYLIPLPPLAEQKRIINKIDDLFALIEGQL
jgi:type I restriction enzyme S subunit